MPVQRPTFSASAIAKVSSTKELMRRVNDEITRRAGNLRSLRDIEDLLTYDFNFVTLLGRQFDSASTEEKAAFAALGFRLDDFQVMREDQRIAQSWIDWFKHKRLEDIEAIKGIEDHIPTRPELIIKPFLYTVAGDWIIFTNIHIPELDYRIRQAIDYCIVLFNVFCAPCAAPAPGEQLPSDRLVPNCEVPAPRRFPHRDYIFSGSKPYGQECTKLINLFLHSTIKGGISSDLLPFVQR